MLDLVRVGRLDYLSNSGGGGNRMILLVTLRFLSIPSHVFYCVFVICFFHVSVVCFNVTLKLSIKDNILQYVQILSVIFPNK